MKPFFLLLFSLFFSTHIFASSLLISMDEDQKNHLKAYGVAFFCLKKNIDVDWLLNYRGGSFLIKYNQSIENELKIRGVSYEVIADAKVNAILTEITQAEVNQDIVKLEKAPKIAVYSPKNKLPWDDAVTMVLTYAEIPYDVVYDEDVLKGKLLTYDWLHLHHEDFTGQYGRFWANYHQATWYQEDVKLQEATAHKMGFNKVSQMKLAVAKTIKNFCGAGGFLFAMCSGTDSYDIALAADGVDICESMYDGDGADQQANRKLSFKNTFAFQDFQISMNPYEYEYSNIDNQPFERGNTTESNDVFTLFQFSAKWDPIPTMLTQCHEYIIKGFMGQTTAFKKNMVKSEIIVMGESKELGEVRYMHNTFGQGFWTFYGGHDPEDYQHLVGEEPTDLKLHPNSAGYRL
ncbi:MAG: asparagine synthetase B, partial [Sphingobacteriales bacterium]